MADDLPLMKSVLTPLAKSVLLPLGLSTGISAVVAAIKKTYGSATTALIIPNEEMEYIMQIAK